MKNNPGNIGAIFIHCNEIPGPLTQFIPIKKILFLSLVLLFFSACSLDTDPESQLPEPIRSYFILYNFLTAPVDLEWEVEGYSLSSVHTYGGTLVGFVTLDEASQDITFVVNEPYSGEITQTGTYRMEENRFYMLTMMGTEEEPYILFEPMDLDLPASGMIKLRFIHTAGDLDSLDLYIGGSTADRRVISGITYKEVSHYVETSLNDLSDTVFVSPHSTAPGTDTVLISFTGIGIFHPDRIYLGVIGHVNHADTSPVELMFYDQPVGY